MIVGLDPCTVGLRFDSESGAGGVLLITQVEGLEGIKFIVPLERKVLEQLYNEIGGHLSKPKIERVQNMPITKTLPL